MKTKRHYYQFIEAAKLKYQKNAKKDEKKDEEDGNEQKDVKDENVDESQNEAEGNYNIDIKNYITSKEQINQIKCLLSTLGDADMYDPEEACKEEELSMEVTNDDGDPSVISLDLKSEIKEENGEDEEEAKQEKEKIKEEPKTTSTPVRQTRTGVKNGAGPKSKKARKQ